MSNRDESKRARTRLRVEICGIPGLNSFLFNVNYCTIFNSITMACLRFANQLFPLNSLKSSSYRYQTILLTISISMLINDVQCFRQCNELP